MSRPDDDLPDIIDVVMQMGESVEAAKAPSPATGDPPPAAQDEEPISPTLPTAPVADERLPGHLGELADRARGYVEAASSANTRRAYASDWKHYSSWCRRQGLAIMPPSAQTVGLYITACAAGTVTGVPDVTSEAGPVPAALVARTSMS